MTSWGTMISMRAINSGRRHRFMEASDFNGAAHELFTVLKHMVVRRVQIRPMFVAFFMDPLTPGRIITAETVSYDDTEIQRVVSAMDGEALGIEAAFKHLLLSEVRPASLAVLVRPVQASVPGQPVQPMVTLDLRSVDGSAATAYPMRGAADSPSLVRRPLEFRRLARRLVAD